MEHNEKGVKNSVDFQLNTWQLTPFNILKKKWGGGGWQTPWLSSSKQHMLSPFNPLPFPPAKSMTSGKSFPVDLIEFTPINRVIRLCSRFPHKLEFN